jgi:hypothetical protein
MKEIITKYLDKNYKFTLLSSYVSYHLVTVPGGEIIRGTDVFATLNEIFSVEQKELDEIYDAWAQVQAIKMENRITDIRYKLYEKTGIELQLTVNDLNNLINLETEQNAEMAEGLMGIVSQNNSTNYRDTDKL